MPIPHSRKNDAFIVLLTLSDFVQDAPEVPRVRLCHRRNKKWVVRHSAGCGRSPWIRARSKTQSAKIDRKYCNSMRIDNARVRVKEMKERPG